MRIHASIIGGTGVGDRLRDLGGKIYHVPTAMGLARGRLIEIEGRNVLVLARHGGGHKVPPHRVNYAAMALALKDLNIPYCFSTAAVGSLRPDWPGGTMAICNDFYDLTYRNPTLFDRSVVHTDFSQPFNEAARVLLLQSAQEQSISVHPNAVYVCGNGPRYETPHEIQQFKQLGDVVGMTAATEAILMREAGVGYACVAVVTNLAAGISESPLSHEEVVEEMQRSGEKVVNLLLGAIRSIKNEL